MSAVYPTLPKLAVRDSVDDDDLTDIDDEVFIRDGRNGGLKLDDDGGVKRPLMAPRRKCKKSCNFQTHKFPYRALLAPLCYGITALIVVLGLIILCIFTANIFPMPLTILKNWLSHELKDPANKSEIIPCTSLSSRVLWTRSLPKLTSEAPLRSNDVNSDGIEDIIVGFSTGLDTMDAPEYICTVYFDGQTPCLGGVLALNGKTGETIWTHWTAHAIFSVDCGADLTNDGTKDCVVSGRGGILQAVNGRDGTALWEVPLHDDTASSSQPGQRRILDVYDARFVADMDGDGVGDVIASHAVQSDDARASDVLLISGRSGDIIRSVGLPDSEQLFIAPQILVHPDGENVFVLATSSQKEAGGLYIASQASMFYGDLQLRKLYHDTGKGALLPPILIDITSDGIEDIVAAMFNSTIMAYNGLTFEPIWNYTVPNSEVISIPIPGYYNDDDVPDFMIKHQIGAGFPTYYYTVATIVDGRNGQALLERPMEDSLSRQMSGLSVTVDDYGNDWFLHWSADCLNHEGVKEKYQFLKGQSLVSQTRADLCRLRFNSTLTTRLLALSQHVGPPGMPLYFSEDWKSLEYNNSIDPRREAEKYLDSHARLDIMDTYADIPLVSERSPKVYKNHYRKNDDASIFKHKGEGNLLPELSKYSDGNTDAVYENEFDEFKGHKKGHEPVVDETAENLDVVERAWKHDGNKWTGDNAQEKEYDGLYVGSDDGNNNNDDDGEQGVDYPQTEMRERRSVAAGTSDPKDPYSISVVSRKERTSKESISGELTWQDTRRQSSEDIDAKKKGGTTEINGEAKEATNGTDATNVSTTTTMMALEEETSSSTASSVESSVEETTALPNTLDISTIATSSEPNGTKSTNLDVEVPKNAEASSVKTKDQGATGSTHRDWASSTDHQIVDVTPRQIYKNRFANIVQDADDDASIEKVFKRESLKNQNGKGGRANRGRSLILSSLMARETEGQKRSRTKRKSETRDGQLSATSGIQRQSPTGILLPSIAESRGRSSIDLVFSTFWLPSSEVSLILSQADLECIHRKKALSESKLQYRKDDDIVGECLSERGVDYRLYQESTDRENTRIALGQLTIYRMKLECVCPEDMLPNQSCRNISSHQSWPEHLGTSGNGYFKPLSRSNV